MFERTVESTLKAHPGGYATGPKRVGAKLNRLLYFTVTIPSDLEINTVVERNHHAVEDMIAAAVSA